MPVTVRADPYAWESPCSQHYPVDKPAGGMKPPPVEEGTAGWVAAHGAVSSGQQYLRLTVRGTGPETAVVDSLTVRVAGKRAPPARCQTIQVTRAVRAGAAPERPSGGCGRAPAWDT
ncbi:hypothetical protein GA0115245_10068 [Streptomyces sp. di188]|nr:hypothetical protein GA0115245_10068 [Streptomyces sp. di188]SCD41235.1 hypothetical protein GA0115238_10754 [Streptomyces sp. di50b]